MVPDTLLFARQNSTDCPPCPAPPPCNCAANEQCVQITRTCNTCFSNKCVPLGSSSKSSGHGISAGAVAGAVIASVVFLAVMVLVYLWYRRRSRLRAAATAAQDAKPDAPARAEDVLNRPDPNEKPAEAEEPKSVRIYAGTSNTTINLDPEAQNDSVAGTNGHNHVLRASVQSNPFTDTHSIQSASTGTQSNVIPIALVPPGSMRSSVPSTEATSGTGPARPARSPDLDLNLGQGNVSNESVRTGGRYAQSTRSGMTNLRNSYMTTGSYSSDFLNEAPVIVTPTTRTVKQVVGMVKAEVIRTPPGTSTSPYSSEDGGTPRTASSVATRTPARSPLAGGSFGPSDVMHGITEEQEQEQVVAVRADPFGDEHSPFAATTPTSVARTSPAPTAATFGDSEENWDPQGPRQPWAKKSNSSLRPDSYMTQAGSIISADIGTASRVHLGLDQLSHGQVSARGLGVPPSGDLPHTPVSAALSTPRSPYRMTSAKLVPPQVSADDQTPMPSRGALEQQQRRAFEELDARMSRSSVVSSTSTRADSILEGFPFVPPSPISDRPIRTPPRSPLAQQAFGGGQNTITGALKKSETAAPGDPDLPPPPNRKMLGMSTASQSSTMSNGLGSFPFQIDSGNGPEAADASTSPPSSFMGRQRASLDTLALTSDLSSYPLGFDKAAMDNYPGPRRS